MIWIGLTGGIASGKSTVAELLRKRGLPVIKADEIVHSLLRDDPETYSLVLGHFGSGVLGHDQSINRKKLGEVVFGNSSHLKALEAILHPRVRDRVASLKAQFAGAGESKVLYEVPLLFEKNLQADFDFVILVACREDVQVQRLMKRDEIQEEAARARVNLLWSLERKRPLSDFIIENNGDMTDLQQQVDQVLVQLNARIS